MNRAEIIQSILPKMDRLTNLGMKLKFKTDNQFKFKLNRKKIEIIDDTILINNNPTSFDELHKLLDKTLEDKIEQRKMDAYCNQGVGGDSMLGVFVIGILLSLIAIAG